MSRRRNFWITLLQELERLEIWSLNKKDLNIGGISRD